MEDPHWTIKFDIQLVFRVISFVMEHPPGVSLLERILLGTRFFYFDEFSFQHQLELHKNWWMSSSLRKDNSMESNMIYRHSYMPPSLEQLTGNLFCVQDNILQLKYTGVRVRLQNNITEKDQRSILLCTHANYGESTGENTGCNSIRLLFIIRRPSWYRKNSSGESSCRSIRCQV